MSQRADKVAWAPPVGIPDPFAVLHLFGPQIARAQAELRADLERWESEGGAPCS